jgi:hypothetical protein
MKQKVQIWQYVLAGLLLVVAVAGLWRWSMNGSNLRSVQVESYPAGPDVNQAPDETELKAFAKKEKARIDRQ